MERTAERTPNPAQDALYATATREFGAALDRLAAGYEADAEKRRTCGKKFISSSGEALLSSISDAR